MSVTPVTEEELAGVLARVARWPPRQRIKLAEGILAGVAQEADAPDAQRIPPQKPFAGLIGLLSTRGDAPTDEEIDRLLEDELLRKYGG